MRSCPHCLSPYSAAVEFCGIDGTRLAQYEVDPLIGTDVDRYTIKASIGDGAMARVYRATHRVLGRDCAIKVLFGEIASNRTLSERFRREAQVISKLDHPNVVSVIDFGTTPNGLTFLTMELIDGRTLREAIRAGAPFPPERAAEVARQIALGLANAHERGFVHRDLKPSNVMLVDDTHGEKVKILDFGLARVADPDEDDGLLTRTGQFLGTPVYMSPEQIIGADVGPTADLYALGVVLYEMLEGRPPFRAKKLAEIRKKHLVDPPPDARPSRGLERLARELLEKSAEKRPPSARDVVARIESMGLLNMERPEITVRTQYPQPPAAPLPAELTTQRIEPGPRQLFELHEPTELAPKPPEDASRSRPEDQRPPIAMAPPPERPISVDTTPPAGAQPRGVTQVLEDSAVVAVAPVLEPTPVVGEVEAPAPVDPAPEPAAPEPAPAPANAIAAELVMPANIEPPRATSRSRHDTPPPSPDWHPADEFTAVAQAPLPRLTSSIAELDQSNAELDDSSVRALRSRTPLAMLAAFGAAAAVVVVLAVRAGAFDAAEPIVVAAGTPPVAEAAAAPPPEEEIHAAPEVPAATTVAASVEPAEAVAPTEEAPPARARTREATPASTRRRREPDPPAPRAAPAQLDGAMIRELTRRGLTADDLSALPDPAAKVEAWRNTYTSGNAAATETARNAVLQAIKSAPLDARIVRKKLDRVSARLASMSKHIPIGELRPLEDRYLDMEQACTPSLSERDASRLTLEAVALLRDIEVAARRGGRDRGR